MRIPSQQCQHIIGATILNTTTDISSELQQLFVSAETRAIIRSDGLGNVTDIIENLDMNPDILAEGIDIALASLQEFARSQELGEATVTMQMCERGTVFSGRHHQGGVVTVVTNNTSNVGILLSIMRRLASSDEVAGL